MSISILKALIGGWRRSAGRVKVSIFVWLFNLLTALLIAVPFMFLVQTELGRSDQAVMVKPFDMMWLADMYLKYGNVLASGLGLVLAGAAAYTLLSVLLNGGFVGRLLAAEGRTTLQSFLSDCGRFFLPFLRLFAVSFVFTAAFLAAVWGLLGALARAASANALTEWTDIIASNLHLLLALVFLAAVRMYFDYARIIMVRENDGRVLHAMRASWAFMKRAFFRAWALYLSIGLFFVLAAAAAIILARILSSPALPAVGLGLLAAQAFVLFRIFVRSLFITSQAEFLKGGES